MSLDIDDDRLDDVEAVAAIDSQQMLRAVATSAAQIRRSITAAQDAGLDALRGEDRPRAVVVAGMGGSGIAGDVLAALATPTSPAPVVVHRGPGLPGWVGAADLVVAVSCSGATAETLSSTDEAIRRGARLIGVCAADSPLAQRCLQSHARQVAVTPELTPRSSFWSLATPVVIASARLSLVDLGPSDGALESAAKRLEAVAEMCRPDRESFVNPAKTLALELSGTVPMAWGAGQMGGVAAYRFACQLAENAKQPVVAGALPEVHHNQVVSLDGPLAGGATAEDLFRDRIDDDQPRRLRLVLLHDDDDPATADRVTASEELAEARGVPVSRLRSEGATPLERLASLVGIVDYASVYLAIGSGIDPTPVAPIDEVKARLA
ncbi:MAG TPA: SIS domain-containing protein [Mycobacteriales bacterium]|nr:SIS domain-containing protein [Mycobacteriales bacterium]